MAKYKYEGTTEEGAKRSGVVDATTLTLARQNLAAEGLSVSDLKPHKSFFSLSIGSPKVPRAEVMHLSRQLAAFVRAGVPIFDAIDTITAEVSNKTLRATLEDIGENLRSGATLSDSFAAHPSIFPSFYVDMLHAAELTGRLDNVLDQLSTYIERDLDARQKIKSALAYPIVIFIMSIVTVVVLTAFVLPRFQTFFESLDAELPLITRVLLASTAFISTWWWLILATLMLIVFLAWAYFRTDRGQMTKAKLIFRLPVIGEIVEYIIIERWCRLMSAMVESGVPLPDAMVVATEGTNNAVFIKGLIEAREEMLKGEGISTPISRSGLFPGTVTQMMRVGEDTGTLDTQLGTAAQFFESELTYKIKRMTTLFEPTVIVLMGFFVGFVAIAVVSAMYGIFRQVGDLGG